MLSEMVLAPLKVTVPDVVKLLIVDDPDTFNVPATTVLPVVDATVNLSVLIARLPPSVSEDANAAEEERLCHARILQLQLHISLSSIGNLIWQRQVLD